MTSESLFQPLCTSEEVNHNSECLQRQNSGKGSRVCLSYWGGVWEVSAGPRDLQWVGCISVKE